MFDMNKYSMNEESRKAVLEGRGFIPNFSVKWLNQSSIGNREYSKNVIIESYPTIKLSIKLLNPPIV
jgi:hypothetical protein